jgi:hypothetical protein
MAADAHGVLHSYRADRSILPVRRPDPDESRPFIADLRWMSMAGHGGAAGRAATGGQAPWMATHVLI